MGIASGLGLQSPSRQFNVWVRLGRWRTYLRYLAEPLTLYMAMTPDVVRCLVLLHAREWCP